MEGNVFAPLADRMRPNKLEDFIGQTHIVYPKSFLVRAIESGTLGSCIFYGPPGTGKTTIANIIAKTCNGVFRKLNAVSSGVADAKEIIQEARMTQKLEGKKTFLVLDECHRWSKAQSDCVLEAIEDGSIIFIGTTTENPYMNMTRAIASRCKIFEFKSLTTADVKKALVRALEDKEKGYGNYDIQIDQDALDYLAWVSGGDIRSAYNSLELAVRTTPEDQNGVIHIDTTTVEQCVQKKSIGIDETTYYDILSAFCKSLRGSDTDAALFYAQKLLLAGVDPKIIARRLIAHASEDVGMADSNALLISMFALRSCEELGMPECNLSLCHAIIYLCEAEKSNRVYIAMEKAKQDAEKYVNAPVPNHLKNHPTGYDDGTGKYLYPHDFGGYVKQQYLPTEIKDHIYYEPSKNGREKDMIRKKMKYMRDKK